MFKNLKSRPGFLHDEDASSTIEFSLLFPAFIFLFLIVVESGMVMTRGVMLDRAVDIAIRDLRIGNLSPMTHAGFKARLCESAVIIPDCENVVTVELRSGDKKNWNPITNNTKCVDREDEIQPVVRFHPGIENELMLVSACAVFDPFFPTTGLAGQMKLDASGAYAIVTAAAYVNEP